MFAWDEEQKQLLRQLWAEGHSASQIAVKMTGRDGLTRCAILGKVHRMGLQERTHRNDLHYGPRDYSTRKKRQRRAPVPLAPVGAVAPLVPSPEGLPRPYPIGLSFFQLKPHACRWPLDDGSYCGTTTCQRGHGSYCEQHAAIAYNATAPSERVPFNFNRRKGA